MTQSYFSFAASCDINLQTVQSAHTGFNQNVVPANGIDLAIVLDALVIHFGGKVFVERMRSDDVSHRSPVAVMQLH